MKAFAKPDTLPWLLIGGLGTALLASGVALWASFGPAIFVDLVVAGWVACFG